MPVKVTAISLGAGAAASLPPQAVSRVAARLPLASGSSGAPASS